jgi:hypothetical protein
MKASLFVGFAFACATSAVAAQTPQTPTTPAAAGLQSQTVTLIGCVAGGAAASDPFTLSDVTQGSVGTATPGQTTSGALPPTTSVAPPTPPAGSVPPASPTGVAGTSGTAVPAGMPATTGTTATAGTSATTGTAATAGTTPTTGAVGTAGTAATGAGSAAGSAAATPAGYVLNGYDVSAYRGQRVQVIGAFAPATATGATPAAGTNPSGAPGAPTPREFRVQSVTPVSGACPQR